MPEWYTPLDFDCPVVREWESTFFGDPMTDSVPGDVIGDITSDWERKHRASCQRCQEFGVANIEIRYAG